MKFNSLHDTVEKDGFVYRDGVFFPLDCHRVERVAPADLRGMFLPTITREGRRKLSDYEPGDFVRGTLQHYGVQFDEDDIVGSGLPLLRTALAAGQCDAVPDRIAALRAELHAAWVALTSAQMLSERPRWIMDKYFLSAGRPDRTKTAYVVGIPTGWHAPHPWQLMYSTDRPVLSKKPYVCEGISAEAAKVPGLHRAAGVGRETDTLYMGWDGAAVRKAAEGHAAAEAEARQAADKALLWNADDAHDAYLKSLEKRDSNQGFWPVGEYVMRCADIEEQCPNLATRFSLAIRPTDDPELFEADFDLGVVEGVMMLSTVENLVELRRVELELEEAVEAKRELDDRRGSPGRKREAVEVKQEDDDGRGPPGRKRKAGSQGAGGPAKKPRADSAASRLYFVRLRCRETFEGDIQPGFAEGTISFDDARLASFAALADFPCVGDAQLFTGKKISDSFGPPKHTWDDFSPAAIRRRYEAARSAARRHYEAAR